MQYRFAEMDSQNKMYPLKYVLGECVRADQRHSIISKINEPGSSDAIFMQQHELPR